MNKSVLITGFGKLAAKTFTAKGWNVTATMRRPENEADLADNGAMFVTRLDTTDTASIDRAVQQSIERFGSLDAVVNNAGYGGHFMFEQADDEVVRAMFETNVFGTMNVCRAVLPHLRAQGQGAIVNVTSMAGMMVLPLGSIYSATKYALQGFTEGLALDYKPFGITVRSILPGAYPTAFTANTNNYLDKGDSELRERAQAVRAKMSEAIGSDPQNPQDVADLIYACVTEPDLPIHNPSGKDAEMLVGLMANGSRDDFVDRIAAMFEPG